MESKTDLGELLVRLFQVRLVFLPEQGMSEAKALLAEVEKQGRQIKAVSEGLETITKHLNSPQTGDGIGKLFAVPRDHKAEGAWGFNHLGEYAAEVRKSRGGVPSEKLNKHLNSELVKKSATSMGELVGSDGGFMVPPTFSDKIFERVYENNDLLKKTDNYTVTGNTMVFPRNNESSRANGSRWGGVRAYWLEEGSTGTITKPGFGQLRLTLHKLMCLGAMTQELADDAGPTMAKYLENVFSDEISFTIGDSLINGTGAGQPLGVLNAACLISVDKETGQAAATLNTQNIVKMYSRLWSRSRKSAAWYINQDVLPALHTLTLGIGTAGVVTFMPAGGLSGKPYATLMGLPIVETEWNATLGTVGDIILADMSQMVSITKGSMNSQTSMHLYFDSDQQAFRVTYRVDAQPWQASALTPFKGSNTQSPFVALATRS